MSDAATPVYDDLTGLAEHAEDCRIVAQEQVGDENPLTDDVHYLIAMVRRERTKRSQEQEP